MCMYRALPTPVAIFHFLLWEETDGVSLLLKAHTVVFLGPVICIEHGAQTDTHLII